jgi:hypothetical protein
MIPGTAIIAAGHGTRTAYLIARGQDKSPEAYQAAEVHTNQETTTREEGMALNKELLDILACPQCKGDLELTEQEDGLICSACEVVYPIKDEIPVMLVDEAVPLNEWGADNKA